MFFRGGGGELRGAPQNNKRTYFANTRGQRPSEKLPLVQVFIDFFH